MKCRCSPLQLYVTGGLVQRTPLAIKCSIDKTSTEICVSSNPSLVNTQFVAEARHMRLNIAAVTNVGCVYAFGRGPALGFSGDSGATTYSSISNAAALPRTRIPTMMVFPGFDMVRHVSCCARHVLICTAEGSLFACGDNRHGQCGQEPAQNRWVAQPQAIIWDLPSKNKIVAVAAAENSSAALDDEGFILII